MGPTSALRSRYCLVRDLRVNIAPESDIKNYFFRKSKNDLEGGRPVEEKKETVEKRAETNR